ncbi:TPA: hypothetical protein HA245_05545 [Candidatus Woesearchaeota archaeon]|nr:hypothetical protein [Candidatus Woesearchaeota archaeon]HIH49109.1 hypothetical protein [Candidatus Woesearchaeota archaeon]HIJ04283.1 hypothetical protein [Candidatus Woesearchaeota archaeon]
MKEHIKIAAEFALSIQHIEGIRQIILFGSVSRGEDTRTSDIDIAITFHGVEKMQLSSQLNKLKPESIQLTLIPLNKLHEETELVGALTGEGILLYGKPIILQNKKTDLTAKLLVSYSMSRMEQTEKVKLNRALYGSTSISRENGKTYQTKTRGLIGEPGIERLQKGVLLIERKKSAKVINVLKRFGAEVKEIPVWTY